MTPDSVHRVSAASREWPEQYPSEPDAAGMAPFEAAAGLDRFAQTNASELRELRALLWFLSLAFLAVGALLTGTDLGSPGFGFGLGAGMVLASLGCLGFLATGRLQAPATDQRPYPHETPFASAFRADGMDAAEETDSTRPLPGDESSHEQEVLSACRLFSVSPEASMREVRARYHRLAHQYHPDKVTGLAPGVRLQAEERMKEINAAYETLQRRRTRS